MVISPELLHILIVVLQVINLVAMVLQGIINSQKNNR
jgi:hypothetical protein